MGMSKKPVLPLHQTFAPFDVSLRAYMHQVDMMVNAVSTIVGTFGDQMPPAMREILQERLEALEAVK
jgi:actin-related protein